MIHYTCDRCKREIDTAEETRYVVHLEVHPAVDLPESAGGNGDDVDHLMELHELLERVDDEDVDGDDQVTHSQRFDLCSACHHKYLKNPLGRDATLLLGFSQN